MREDKRTQAEEAVKTRLVLQEIIKNENLFVTKEEINSKIAKMAEKYKKSVEDYRKQLGDRQIAYYENDILMKKLLKFLKDNNNII